MMGYPPYVYTQNGSECANFIIKHAKNQNKQDMYMHLQTERSQQPQK